MEDGYVADVDRMIACIILRLHDSLTLSGDVGFTFSAACARYGPMSIPHIELTESQHRILAELMVADLPSPDGELASVEARGLAAQVLAAEVPTLRWLKLITDTGGALSVTMLGAAIFHRARQEEAEARLAAVVSFADVLEAAAGSRRTWQQAPRALRQLAQGTISRDQAVRLVLS